MKYQWQTHNKAIPMLLDFLDTHQKEKEKVKENKKKEEKVTFDSIK